MTAEIMEMFVKLLVMLPIVLLLAFLAVKYGISGRLAVRSGSHKYLKLIEQLPLGPKTVVSLVKAGSEFFIIMQYEGGCRVIKELDNLPEIIEGDNSCDDSTEFGRRLKNILDRKLGHAEKPHDRS